MEHSTLEYVESDIAWLKSRYMQFNDQAMPKDEEDFFRMWMEYSANMGDAYRLGNCFIYLAPQDSSLAVLAVCFPEDEWDNAGRLYCQVKEERNPDVYIPLGQHFFDMLPFIRRKSLAKWRRGARRNIVLHANEVRQAAVAEYLS